jgi:hypothetical protein
MPAVAAPQIDWTYLTGAYRAGVPVSPVAAVVVTPSQFNPVSKFDDNFCPVGGGGGNDTFAYPIGG